MDELEEKPSVEAQLTELNEQLKAKGVPLEEPHEETQVEAKAEETAEAVAEAKKELDLKTLAKEYGYHEDAGNKTPEDFVRYALERVEPQQKSLKRLKAQVNELVNHVTKLKKSGYEQQLEKLKEEKKEAIVRGDSDYVEYVDQQMSEVQTEMNTPEINVHPALTDFDERHKDLITDYSLEAQEIKEFIQERSKTIVQFTQDPEVLVQTIEKDLRTKYPSRFGGNKSEKKAPVQAVESDANHTSSGIKKSHTFKDLNRIQKDICRSIVRNGGSQEGYIQQLVELGEL